ncbi:T9SS C-terminal target domain-containing protein [bacterium]|nr:MAG: T9SS C-terminal target domain-containing protein [bacterium]
MKTRNLLCILMLLMAAAASFAQVDTLWTSRFIGAGGTTLLGATNLSDGGFAVVGFSRVNWIQDDFFAARLDENGSLLWLNTYNSGDLNDRLEDVVELADGSLFAVGSLENETKMAFMGISADGDSLWTQTTNLKGLLAARDIYRLANGNLGVLGFALGADSIHSDVQLMECDENGTILWSQSYGGSLTDTGTRLTQRLDGTLQLCGNYASAGSEGYSDFWTLRTDNEGTPIGEHRLFGTSSDERAYDVVVNSLGDVYLCGTQYTGSSFGYVVKIPATGDGWEQTYSSTSENLREYRGMIPRFNGVLCVGRTSFFSGQSRPLISYIGPDGNEEWSWSYGVDEPTSGFYGILKVPSGGALAFGVYRQVAMQYGFTMRIAPPGGISGVVRDVVSGEPVPLALVSAVGVEGHAVSDMNGVYNLELNPGTYDLLVHGFCVDSSLHANVEVIEHEMTVHDLTCGVPRNPAAATSINMYGRDELTAIGYYPIRNEGSGTLYFAASVEEVSPLGDWISVSPASGSVPPGHSRNIEIIVNADVNATGLWDYLGELRVSTNTCPDTLHILPVIIAVLDIDGHRPEHITSFQLHPAFPNPFNAETTLRFDLPVASPVEMNLYNLQGQLVKTLLSGQVDAGTHEVALSLPDYPSGVYLVNLTAGQLSATQKIVLIK